MLLLPETYDPLDLGVTPTKILVSPSNYAWSRTPIFAVLTSRSGFIHIHSSVEADTPPQLHDVTDTQITISADHYHGQILVSAEPGTADAGYDTYMAWGHDRSAGWLFAGVDASDDQEDGCQVIQVDLRSFENLETACGVRKWRSEVFPLERNHVQVLSVSPEGMSIYAILFIFKSHYSSAMCR
jgi:hypothetical protein